MTGVPPRKKRIEEIDRQALAEPILTPSQRDLYERGIALFNDRRFWDAHEAWEEVWLGIPDESRIFFQGIIQAAAGYHLLVERPRPSGALKNLKKSLEKLELFPDAFLGVDLAALKDAVRRSIASMTEEGTRVTKGTRVEGIPKLSRTEAGQ